MGVALDFKEALKWFRSAADQLDGLAQYSLGTMYEHGEGVPKSFAEAAKWYRMAADQGDSTAQYRVGKMFAAGEGVLQDAVEAWEWLDLAAEAGETDAAKSRDAVASGMTAAEIAQARRLVER